MVNGKITVRNDKYDNTHVCYLTILTKELAFFWQVIFMKQYER